MFYSREWRTEFAEAAVRIGITLYEGVYASVIGPQYETPTEVRIVRQFGADAIGMSTVLEAIQSHALGLQTAAFSCLTNWAAGMATTNSVTRTYSSPATLRQLTLRGCFRMHSDR